jgi:gliding motility-associated-like protein
VGSITPPMEPNNCDWQTYTSSVWNSGTNTSVNICIQNSTPVASLLAIDNLRFSPFVTCEESDSVTITVVDQANAGIDGTLEFCEGETPTDTQLFAALGGTPDTGGTWTGPVNNVYTYTVSGTIPCPDDSSTVTILPIIVSNPIVDTTPATCSSAGMATITNFDANITYIFNPTGPTVDANGGITGLTCGINYTVTASNGSCDSAAVPFGVACQLPTPDVPVVSTTPATCNAAGSAVITNVAAGVTYTFVPAGPTVDALGNISNLVCGTAYTLTATLGNCTSAPSSVFTVDCQLLIPFDPIVTTTPATCSAAGGATISNFNATITYIFDPTGPTVDVSGNIIGLICGTNYTVTASNGSCDSAAVPFGVACQLPTPDVPLVSTTPATCNAAGSAVITNVTAGVTYTFVPSGPTVDALGNISNFDCGTSYTVTATLGACISAPSALFTIDCQLLIPIDPIVNTTPATCSAAGGATISNFDATITYIFDPTGPTVDATGNILGLICGTNYTVTANNGSCSSAAVPFGVACQLPTPDVPLVSTTPATCNAAGSATITNFATGVTYTFVPAGPTVDATGNIFNFDCGTSYTVTATLGTCTSVPSAAFTIGCQLLTPVNPIVSTTPATCSAAGTATISNFVVGNTYIFNPTGPTVGANGIITGLNCVTNYTVTANNGSCSSSAIQFSVACQLPSTETPTIVYTAADCFNQEAATISNYNQALTYTFTPSSGSSTPSIGANGVISGLDCNVSYTLVASNGQCPSAAVTIDVECIVTNACQIPRGISPNGDGLNDVWDIEFLNAKRVEIFNRYGMIVYSRDNYRKEWGGLSNDGQQLSDGTYFYVITLENENKSGWVYINRERR